MIVTELVFLSIITIVHAIIGRCYLCSQETLAECVGSEQSNALTYINVLQYHTEPCNGQCILFRNENRSIIRGCSWTYGQMTSKSIGWHELSPGIKAYFCNSHLCNNGTYEKPEISRIRTQLVLLTANYFGGYSPRRLHQCYSCTARFQGCGEFLDPHYASNYIRACPTSCIIFRNPNDLNLITRDCSMFWPQVRVRSGFHKLLGTDAFFCQESLCNGISFDFIMGILHHQLPAAMTLPTIRTNENLSTTTTTDVYNNNVIWDDPDLDFVIVESTTSIITNSSISTNELDKILPNDNSTIENTTSLSLSSTLISSTISIEEDDSISTNTTSIQPITRFEHLSANDHIEETNQTIDIDDDYLLSSTTPIIDLFTFIPYYFLNNQTNNQFFEYINPLSTLAIPPFSWMLSMAAQNKSQFSTSTTTTTTSDTLYEYCKNKQCHHHGRLNSDCLCICLPTFTGENCETVLCEEEPADVCAFVLEHECQMNHIRYLCPKFCQLDICSSNFVR